MAFNFIKKVFSFGSNKVEETPVEDAGKTQVSLDLEAARKASEDAERDAARQAEQAEREAALRLEQEAALKLAREAEETAKRDAEAEAEAAKIAAEEHKAREAAQAEAARKAKEDAEQEAALRLERETAQKLAREAEETAKRDAEAARIAAEERIAREAAEAEAARKAQEDAEREVKRVAALQAAVPAAKAQPGGMRRMFDKLLGKTDFEAKAPVEPPPAAVPAPEAPEPVAETPAPPVAENVPEPSEPDEAPDSLPLEGRVASEASRAGLPKEARDAPSAPSEPAPPVEAEPSGAETAPPVSPLRDETPSPQGGGIPVAPTPLASEPQTEPPKLATGKVTVAKSVEAKAQPVAPAPAPKLSWFQRMRAGLSRSSQQLSASITGVFTKKKLDEETLQDLEDVLIRADLGVETALRVTDTLAATRMGRDISDAEVRGVMAAEIEKVLTPVAMPLELDLSHKPHVILVVGVNGTGKTTTIGKLAAKLSQGGLNVMLAAGDTFRAAAIEQLKIWGERTKSPVISSKLGADAAGLAYDAFEKAKEAGADVLIIDTAGRLQNRTELMAELEKIVRVLGKLDPDAPHTVLQTVDATTGQNALNQVEIFRNVAGVNGLVMTKLDGTARGGILVAIAAKHKLPVYFIGVGEQVDDLEPFSANEFARAIAGVA